MLDTRSAPGRIPYTYLSTQRLNLTGLNHGVLHYSFVSFAWGWNGHRDTELTSVFDLLFLDGFRAYIS